MPQSAHQRAAEIDPAHQGRIHQRLEGDRPAGATLKPGQSAFGLTGDLDRSLPDIGDGELGVGVAPGAADLHAGRPGARDEIKHTAAEGTAQACSFRPLGGRSGEIAHRDGRRLRRKGRRFQRKGRRVVGNIAGGEEAGQPRVRPALSGHRTAIEGPLHNEARMTQQPARARLPHRAAIARQERGRQLGMLTRCNAIDEGSHHGSLRQTGPSLCKNEGMARRASAGKQNGQDKHGHNRHSRNAPSKTGTS